MKKYKCPHCQREQTSLGENELVSVDYEYDLEQESWEELRKGDAEHKFWFCPDCGEELEEKLVKKIAPELL